MWQTSCKWFIEFAHLIILHSVTSVDISGTSISQVWRLKCREFKYSELKHQRLNGVWMQAPVTVLYQYVTLSLIIIPTRRLNEHIFLTIRCADENIFVVLGFPIYIRVEERKYFCLFFFFFWNPSVHRGLRVWFILF